MQKVPFEGRRFVVRQAGGVMKFKSKFGLKVKFNYSGKHGAVSVSFYCKEITLLRFSMPSLIIWKFFYYYNNCDLSFTFHCIHI